MVLRRTSAVAVPLLLGGLLVVPAAAGPTPAGTGTDPGLVPGAALHVRSDGTVDRDRSPVDALTAGATDLLSLLRLTADAASAADEQQAVLVGTAEEPQAFAAAVPAGDLDGDGLADLVAYRGDSASLRLDALRGTDGALLWTTDLSADGALTFPVGRDLTGDGVHDLLVDAVVEQGQVDEREDGYRYSATVEQTYGVVSGADGTRTWQRTTTGTVEDEGRYTGDPFGVVERSSSTLRVRDLVLPLLSPDLTGDGTEDLAVSEISYAYDRDGTWASAPAAGAFYREAALRGSTRLLSVDGRAGEATQLRATEDVAGVAYALPVGALVGGTGDLLWVTETLSDAAGGCAELAGEVQSCSGQPFGASGTTVERLDGRTGTSRWSLAVDDAAYAFALGADADADGTDDVVVEQLFAGRVAVVSGATGALLWELVDEDALPLLLGVEDGVAVVAGLEASFDDDDPGQRATLVVRRLSARTGAPLSEDRRPVPLAQVDEDMTFSGVFLYAGITDDGDGDDRSELVLGTQSFALGFPAEPQEDEEPTEPTAEDYASSAVVEPFAGGAPLIAETSDDLRVLAPFDDLDGDGLQDVARLVDDGHDVDVTALRLVDRGVLWRSGDGFPLPAGDQDGAPGVELVEVVDGAQGPEVRSLRGADRAERWRVPGERPTAPAA